MSKFNRKIIVGLTGGIASGKSSVLRQFKQLGAEVLDCDKLAREAVQPGKPAYNKIVRLLGKDVVQSNGRLLRKKIAKIIFNNRRKRKQLEKIIHPEVIRQMKKRIRSIPSGLVVADIPLLFEAKLTKLVDKTVVVWTPLKKQIQRLMQRDRISKRDALIRIRSQISLYRKRMLADEIIDNSGSPAEMRKKILLLYKKFVAPLLTKKSTVVK